MAMMEGATIIYYEHKRCRRPLVLVFVRRLWQMSIFSQTIPRNTHRAVRDGSTEASDCVAPITTCPCVQCPRCVYINNCCSLLSISSLPWIIPPSYPTHPTWSYPSKVLCSLRGADERYILYPLKIVTGTEVPRFEKESHDRKEGSYQEGCSHSRGSSFFFFFFPTVSTSGFAHRLARLHPRPSCLISRRNTEDARVMMLVPKYGIL